MEQHCLWAEDKRTHLVGVIQDRLDSIIKMTILKASVDKTNNISNKAFSAPSHQMLHNGSKFHMKVCREPVAGLEVS